MRGMRVDRRNIRCIEYFSTSGACYSGLRVNSREGRHRPLLLPSGGQQRKLSVGIEEKGFRESDRERK